MANRALIDSSGPVDADRMHGEHYFVTFIDVSTWFADSIPVTMKA